MSIFGVSEFYFVFQLSQCCWISVECAIIFCKKCNKRNISIGKYFMLCKTLGWENVLMHYINMLQTLSRHELCLALKETQSVLPGWEVWIRIGDQRFLFNWILTYSAPSLQNTVLGSLADILMKRTPGLSSCGLQARDALGININAFGPSSWELISAKHWVECWEMRIKQMWTLSSVLAGLRKQIHKLP